MSADIASRRVGPDIMRRELPTIPYDGQADEYSSDDLTREFWGDDRAWISGQHHSVSGGSVATRRRVEAEPASTDWLVDDRHTGGRLDPCQPTDDQPADGRDVTGSIRAIREGFAAFRPRTADTSGEIARTRVHGFQERVAAPPRREATLGELADGRSVAGGWLHEHAPDDSNDAPAWAADADDHLIPLDASTPLTERLGLGTVDPRLARIGAVLVLVVLLVPVMLSLRPDRGTAVPEGFQVDAPVPVAAGTDLTPGVQGDESSPSPIAASPTTANSTATSTTVTEPVVTASAGDASAVTADTSPPAVSTDTGDATDVTAADSSTGDVVEVATVVDPAASVAVPAERVVPSCPQTYTAAAGDSWYRIADAAGISTTALFAENNATVDTVMFPGDEICLPADATVPSPPTTVAPATTAVPTTTAAPTTTVAPTIGPVSQSEAAQIIRDVWPDELEERALEIAWRESGHQADAYNGWCCYGLFQLYYSVHDSWLPDYGVHQASDLFDARKNAEAAYALYRAAGGWSPWSTA